MSILSLAIDQKKKNKGAGGSVLPSAPSRIVPSILGAAIQAKKSGLSIPVTGSLPSTPTIPSASQATTDSVLSLTNRTLRNKGIEQVTMDFGGDSKYTKSDPVWNRAQQELEKRNIAPVTAAFDYAPKAEDPFPLIQQNQETNDTPEWMRIDPDTEVRIITPESQAAAEREKAEKRAKNAAFWEEWARIVLSSSSDNPMAASAGAAIASDPVIAGAAEDYLGQLVSAFGTMIEGSVERNPANRSVEILREVIQDNGKSEEYAPFMDAALKHEQESNANVSDFGQDIRGLGRDMSSHGQTKIEEQKEDMDAFGRTMVDVGVVGTQMVMDIGLGWLTKFGMAGPMAVRVFGSSAEEAASEGADLQQQLKHGLGSATVAYGLEHISNVAMAGLKVVAPGIGDDFVAATIDKLALKLAKTPQGATALKMLGTLFASGVGEGFEEVLEGFLNPYIKKLTHNPNAATVFDDPSLMADYLYDGLLGMIMGLSGGGVNVGINTSTGSGSDGDLRSTYEKYQGVFTDKAINSAYESLKKNGMFSQQGLQDLANANRKTDSYVPSWQKSDGVRRAAPGVAAQADDKSGRSAAQEGSQRGSEDGNAHGGIQPANAPAVSQGAQDDAISTELDTRPSSASLNIDVNADLGAAANASAAAQQMVSDLDTEAKAPGFYSNGRFTGTAEDAAYLDQLAKAAGISIEIAETKDGTNGWIVNGKAYLSEDSEDPFRVVAKHEVTHHLQDAAGEAYNEYRSYVEQIYRNRGTLNQQIQAVQQLYRRNGKELSRSAALDELAADYAGELLENEALIRKLAGEKRSLGQKILDAIRGLLQRVRVAFSSAEVKQLDRAARLWEAALSEAHRAYDAGAVSASDMIRYSIGEIVGKKKHYGVGVILDTNLFDNVKPRDWGKVLNKYVYENLAGAELTMYDDSGTPETVYLAKETDRVRKDGAKNSHKVLDKLARYKGDNIRALATVHLAEALEASNNETSTDEHSHQWMDENGWTYRQVYLQERNGSIYEATLNIANGRDRRILYDINQIRKVDTKKEATGGVVPSTETGGGSLTNGDFSNNVPQERKSVKGSRDLQKQIDALERQNRRLKAQLTRTDVPKVRRDVVKRSARDLRSMYSSRIDIDALTDRIEALYNQIAKLSGAGNLQELNGIPSWTEVKAEARSIADAILEESRGNVNPMAEEYGEIRRELRGRKISISDEYRADLESAGGYDEIRKQNFGTFTLSRDGAPIDTVYDELNEKYPTLFPDDIVHPADQLIRLSDVLQELKTVEGNPFENDLDTTAQYLAGEIEERFYDTPNQRPTLADKMANEYHRQRARDQRELRAKLADQKRAYEEQVDRIHAQYASENRTRLANQNAAQRRETIYRHANRLGKMLQRPTDKRHIPEQLRGAALHMLRYINTESNYQLAYGEDAKYHRVAPGEILGAEDTGRTAAARALRAVYDDILKEGELSVDPDIGDYLEELAKMGNKTLGDMSRAELDTVWRVMQVIEHSITRANELHGEGRYRTVEGMANALREGVGSRKDRTNWAGPAGMVDQLLNRDMITPETFFHVLGDVGENIFRQMRRSADHQTLIIKEGAERAAKLIKESGVEFKKLDREHHTFHLDGGNLTLSTSQLMELYALNKRKQAMEHIYIGGLKSIGGVKGLRETGRSKPVKVTPEDVGTMLETLTDEQKALMDALQTYLSGDLAKHGNEESMKVYGYEKFKEKNYWPIKVSRTETKSDPTNEARSKTIPGYGMTKAVIPQASNSVELRSAIDTFAAHLNQMATYASWLGTNEDVTRFHNFKFTDDQMHADGTVKELFERVYGKKGSAYLDNLLSDIAQGTKTGADKTLLEGMFGRWKAAKVGGNLRVIVQQPTAILRAMSVMDPKYLATTKNPLSGWKKALKYSSIAQWKDWGYFEMDTGRSIRELITGAESNLDKAKNAFMWGAGAADSVSWGHLWNAVEAETAAKHKNLPKGSKEFYEAVAKRFAEIVDRTQVVDSVLHRTQIMRSNSYAAKLSTSFMSEPSKIYNMVVRDLYDLKNATGYEQRKAAGKQLARTSSALVVSFAVNAAAQALVDGLRDDDRDKKYSEKFIDALPGNFASNFNPISYIPYFKDVWSLIDGYTLDRSDMEGVSDLVNAVGQLGKAMQGNSEKSVFNAGLNAACRLGDILGIPVSNLKRDAEAIFNTVLVDAGLQELQYEMDKLLYNPENAKGIFVGDLYRAMDTDPDAYNRIWEDLQTMPIENIESSMETRMKKELGLNSVKNLPIRYSAPGEDRAFDALMREAAENHTNWYEELPDGSVELAQALDALGTDAKKLERVVEIGDSQYDNDVKYSALQLVLSEKEFDQFESARRAGISIKLWTKIYEAVTNATIARRGSSGSASQDDVISALNKLNLTAAQKRAIWNSYGWKADSPW